MTAITAGQFAVLMDSLGPFEPSPRIAVALSGGADSLALTLLLQDWLAARDGKLLALTVDHGLRQGSAAEAAKVAALMRRLGIAQKVLRWDGVKPTASRQAAARDARYALLSRACEARGIFHLALAHHLEDQAETFLLRLGRGSGLDGLAAMAPVVENANLRLLRPLLTVPKEQLVESLRTHELGWIEDPSNTNEVFARVRMRRLLPELAREGMSADRLGSATQHLARARAALEVDVAAVLARAARPDPAGFLEVHPAMLADCAKEVSLRALARCLMAVGGSDYTPRLDRLERLHSRLRSGLGKGATLGGCRILARGSQWLIVREAGRSAPAPLEPGIKLLWDGRFELVLGRQRQKDCDPLAVGALGTAGWRQLAAGLSDAARRLAGRIPAAARAALPALSDREGLAAVPPLGYFRDESAAKRLNLCRFAPTNGLTGAAFTVV
ncbi:tRNA lysidine(34) synthetase TilS [Pelagibius litoralis]|uniref:tRNA(Ile)-lysidine synthase n=1 Tax=Pelagibius litoralis TaxID=374515 RepID=A0A967EZX9_9PROT|nr:tRNA lysidine(34) synthetase TilS [Pelagibius litoralis]NIA70487.1 tRNA lysidine(34) synthetase TilS [Pelagibius litoralis]